MPQAVVAVLWGSGCSDRHDPSGKTPAIRTPKEECEDLLNEFLPVAERFLSKYGEFHPFGGTLSVDGEITYCEAWTGSERPPATELIEVYEDRFREGAVQGKYKATALVVDVLTVPPGKSRKQDAISVRLDHRDGYSVVVLLPYSFGPGGALDVEAPFATEGQGRIFSGSGK